MAEPDPAGELYTLPLEDFTAARNELAARLRKGGDRAAAAAVKVLAKPSLSAWALNQVAHRQPKLVAALLAAGHDLAQAQQRLLGGGGQAAFREASRAEKAALAKLVEAAAGVLAEAGHPAAKAMLDRLEATARAAATDDTSGQLLEAGRLTADLDPTGFGDVGAFSLARAPIPFPHERRPAQQKASAAHSPSAEAREEVHRLQREVQALRQQAGQAEGEAARTRQAAARANQAWSEARDSAARAEKLAGEAKRAEDAAAEALAELRRRIDLTADELARAEAELKQRRG